MIDLEKEIGSINDIDLILSNNLNDQKLKDFSNDEISDLLNEIDVKPENDITEKFYTNNREYLPKVGELELMRLMSALTGVSFEEYLKNYTKQNDGEVDLSQLFTKDELAELESEYNITITDNNEVLINNKEEQSEINNEDQTNDDADNDVDNSDEQELDQPTTTSNDPSVNEDIPELNLYTGEVTDIYQGSNNGDLDIDLLNLAFVETDGELITINLPDRQIILKQTTTGDLLGLTLKDLKDINDAIQNNYNPNQTEEADEADDEINKDAEDNGVDVNEETLEAGELVEAEETSEAEEIVELEIDTEEQLSEEQPSDENKSEDIIDELEKFDLEIDTLEEVENEAETNDEKIDLEIDTIEEVEEDTKVETDTTENEEVNEELQELEITTDLNLDVNEEKSISEEMTEILSNITEKANDYIEEMNSEFTGNLSTPKSIDQLNNPNEIISDVYKIDND